jgi:hypothetical protein
LREKPSSIHYSLPSSSESEEWVRFLYSTFGMAGTLGWPLEPTFYIPDEVLAHLRKALDKGAKLEGEWKAKLELYGEATGSSKWNGTKG